MRTATLVFARLDSHRLPGKVLRPILGRPMLGHVLDRLRRSQRCGRIVVATSDRPCDDPIAEFARADGAELFRGAAEDVAGRALACARHFGFDRIVRVSGDSPFVDPAVLDAVVELHDHARCDVATNVHPRTFPPGLSVEVFTVAALARLVALTDDPEDREHVTRYFYGVADLFSIANHMAQGPAVPNVRLVVDDELDLARAAWIAARAPSQAGYRELADLARDYDGSAASNIGSNG